LFPLVAQSAPASLLSASDQDDWLYVGDKLAFVLYEFLKKDAGIPDCQ
jgi:hypothetical protein